MAYHHGDLRRALIKASLECIETDGPDVLTLREVGRRAGVSHAAPYRHFSDKQALLEAVAQEGFEALTRALEASAKRGRRGRAALIRAGVAYVRFAGEQPAHFRVMFEVELREEATQVAAASSFLALLKWVELAQDSGEIRRGDSTRLARFAWSLVHGISELVVRGKLPLESTAARDRFARDAVEGLLSGLDA